MRLWGIFLLLCPLLLSDGRENDCDCPTATALTEFPVTVPVGVCCLNYSGSSFRHVQWEAFSSHPALRILDLSHCNISQIHHTETRTEPAMLQNLYLGHNSLSTLPEGFLVNASGLRVLDLSMNHLKVLPERFLQESQELQELDLRGNLLTALPSSLLIRHGWQRLELSHNPWVCTCSLVGELQDAGLYNSTSISSLADIVGNVTCVSPQSVAGRSVWSVQHTEVCTSAGLTALFILLPLLMLAVLVLCWFCGRKRKRKESPAFGLAGKKASSRGSQLTDCNGRWHHSKHATAGGGELVAPREGSKDNIMKNQLLLRPSSALLGSTRDIYEEVEIRLGSVESLTRPPSSISTDRQEALELGSKPDLETVSVTEVMKDSANREKAYLTQSTEYYSLVPAIEIEDSDHGEYESVDLS